MYKGQAVSLVTLDDGLVELQFDLKDSSVNILNQQTLTELSDVLAILKNDHDLKGLLISSTKSSFIVGADISEFVACFKMTNEELTRWVGKSNTLFSELENLPYPTVAAINGLALGGGLELALAADFRVLADDAKVGLPEVNLGLCPGLGGTVRLSRLIGFKAAVNWMISGTPQKATEAQALGVVDMVVSSDILHSKALELLNKRVIDGERCYTQIRARKQQLCSDSALLNEELQQLQQKYAAKLNPDYPAATVIIEAISKHMFLPFDAALLLEHESFVKLAKSDASKSLIGLYLNTQKLKKQANLWSQKALHVQQSAVLGAGIMGGGIAYQSASTGTPIIMKDINNDALLLGMKTAATLLDNQIKKGSLDEAGKDKVLNLIDPTLSYDDFAKADLVVEAVVENAKVKASVLVDVEKQVSKRTVIASNTSTISIDLLAETMDRPELFCGMHFFNPVHLMPLVEVIRGSKTSDETIATTVAYATSMGKTAIVVNDCPGFLVNRILFPYFNGFNRLLLDGVEYQKIDKVMEQFGWPMGPAYLADVVGIDTLVHADKVMQQGFPERMSHDGATITEGLLALGCLGQKSGKGFYEYGIDENGRRYKNASSQADELIKTRVKKSCIDVTDQEIIDRMMIPLCFEAVRCLEDGIVGSAAEVDMGLILGLGFPRFRGGPLRFIDTVGLDEFAQTAQKYRHHGPLYQLPVDFVRRQNSCSQYFI